MSFSLEITDAARSDLKLSYEWYEKQSPGLGSKFIEAVEWQLNFILEHPEANPVFTEDYRRVNTKRFPFKIIYSISENRITVYAVYHHSRNIEKWKR